MQPDVAFIEKFLAREEADALLDRIRAESEFQVDAVLDVRLEKRAEA